MQVAKPGCRWCGSGMDYSDGGIFQVPIRASSSELQRPTDATLRSRSSSTIPVAVQNNQTNVGLVKTGGFMLYRVRPLACIVPFVLLAGCASQPPIPPDPGSPATRPPAVGCTDPLPDYPAEARRMRIEGSAVVSGVIEPDGSISGVRIKRSSGNALLDEAAVQAVRSMACAPFKDPKTGQPMRVPFSRPFAFGLDRTPPMP
ncbi:energy transducer TonB [Ralstonia sp.]|uniref:energy transducer TonB n=1 Tax=Ralstonia sp. TaxID=54061 RepID=UPI0039C9318D